MQIQNCEKCGDKKDWDGSDIECPFQEIFEVFGDNWNCGIINEIRNICDAEHPHINYQYCDDQKYCAIKIDDCENEDGSHIGLCLFVTWYKDRGRTDAMWILNDEDEPHKPTYDELSIIIKHFKQLLNGDKNAQESDTTKDDSSN